MKKGFFSWLRESYPDVLCLQETRISIDQLPPDLSNPIGYYAYWNSASRPGYSGTALLSRQKPLSVSFETGKDEFDKEGRLIIAEFKDFILINCYFPNGNSGSDRLSFKFRFLDRIHQLCNELLSDNKNLVLAGDANIAHTELDLAAPNANKNNSGFLKEERMWFDNLLSLGLTDTFRYFYRSKRSYSWFPSLPGARERLGWRFDYILASDGCMKYLSNAYIQEEIRLSDHCPIGVVYGGLLDDLEQQRSGFSERQGSLF